MATFEFAFSSGGKTGNALQVHWWGGWREVPVALRGSGPGVSFLSCTSFEEGGNGSAAEAVSDLRQHGAFPVPEGDSPSLLECCLG